MIVELTKATPREAVPGSAYRWTKLLNHLPSRQSVSESRFAQLPPIRDVGRAVRARRLTLAELAGQAAKTAL